MESQTEMEMVGGEGGTEILGDFFIRGFPKGFVSFGKIGKF